MKLFSLPEPTLAHIIKCESQTMIPILAASGILVTEDQIKAEIYKDQKQKVLIVFRRNHPSAWIRYGFLDGNVFVKSIHLDQELAAVGALRGLLRLVLEATSDLRGLKIESVVQAANSKSLALHVKLGFAPVKQGPRATRFSIAAEALRENLIRLF